MIAPTPDMDSCEIHFIDTVFFGDEGKPVNIIKTDKEGKLSSTTQANKLVPNDIRQKFSSIWKDRKNETKNFVQVKLAEEIANEKKENKEAEKNQGSPTRDADQTPNREKE